MLALPKRNKEKHEPNYVVFLVEGKSDRKALELPLSEMIYEKHPDYQVRFLLQQREYHPDEDDEDDDEDEDEENAFIEEKYIESGDITTCFLKYQEEIVRKIELRFIKPATRAEGIYPKRIAKIIHLVDLDGAYISDEKVLPFSTDHRNLEKPYYNEHRGVIEARDVSFIRGRNERKRNSIDYLLSLSPQGIKIGSRRIPYEIYFFSSNLDHFIHHDANLTKGKVDLADEFLRGFGFDTEKFSEYFINDPDSIGRVGYDESWNRIRNEDSIRRHTNIDWLIQKLLEE